MPTYSAAQIVGKTLIARKNVSLKRMPSDSAATVYTAKRGETIGVVYSWVGGENSGPLWWSFYDANNAPYYVKHEAGAFDIGALQDQGAITVKEATELQNQEQSGGLFSFDFKGAKNLAITVFGLYIGAKAIDFITKKYQ